MGSVKRKLLASVAGAAVSFAAAGAVPALAQARWTGFYSGLYAGSAWGRSDAASIVPCTDGGASAYLCGATPTTGSLAVAANGSGSVVSAHFTGGFQAGHNWQIGYFVYGWELDFGAFNLQGSRSVTANYLTGVIIPGTGNRYAIGTSIDTDWLFTLRGRLGWTFGTKGFLYATGGLAVTRIAATNSFSDNFTDLGGPAAGGGSYSGNKVGWTVGGGLERALDKDWSVKIEYLYVDFGSICVLGLITAPGGYSQGLNTSFDVSAHIVRAGFNYRF